MAQDLFEQLADIEVPPLPENFDHGVHQRVNRILLAAHLVELAVKACTWTCVHFAVALGELVIFTLSGRFRTVRPASEGRDSTDSAP